MGWLQLSSKVLVKNRWLKVRQDLVVRSDGSQSDYYIVERPNFVLIIPQIKDNRFLMVDLYRYPVDHNSLEFPMGMTEGQDHQTAARREAEEETGWRPSRLSSLGWLDLANGLSTERFEIFLATGLTHGRQRLDPGEHGMVVQELSGRQIETKIAQGKIIDGPTIAAWQVYKLKQARSEFGQISPRGKTRIKSDKHNKSEQVNSSDNG